MIPGKEEAIIYPLSASTLIPRSLSSHSRRRPVSTLSIHLSLSLLPSVTVRRRSHLSKLKYNLCFNFWSFVLSRTQLFFLIAVYVTSNARKYCQIQLILPELCDSKARRIQRNFFPIC